MTYRQGFDRLGNPLPPRKPDWQDKAIQWTGWAVVAVCFFLMVYRG